MEARAEWYGSRAELERGVERMGDEGWVLGRIVRVSEGAIRAEFERYPLPTSDSVAEPARGGRACA